MAAWDDRRWNRYVSVSERRTNAAREMQKLKQKGHPVSPVVVQGRTIAHTFWGKAWCENLERYSDFSNRLPRGRTYVRNGSVVDLQITPGQVAAFVSGSRVYKTQVKISALAKSRWDSLCADCAGGIDSLVELLQGRFSTTVMERMCRRSNGLFPTPAEIEFSCSCPDWASMCKHVAAVLYAIGARLDERPELLFRLRKVDESALLARAGKALPLSAKAPEKGKVLATAGLPELFGIEIVESSAPAARTAESTPAKARRPRATSRSADTKPAPAKKKATHKSAVSSKTSTRPKITTLPAEMSAVARRKKHVAKKVSSKAKR